MSTVSKERVQSLRARDHELARAERQLALLGEDRGWPAFEEKLSESGLFPLKPTGIEILQVNLGKMCNQTCKHCHVDAGPDRKEIMSLETLQQCLAALKGTGIKTVDLTGGAPEMNPHFRWFVQELHKEGVQVLVRCNLTIILANPKYHDLPEFYKAHGVEVVSSLPFYNARRTDSQRGSGVFDKSVRALQMLNEVGYGKEGTGLSLNLVYNPTGAFMPGDQSSLEQEFKRALKRDFDIEFTNLFAITNLPVSRFLDYLIQSGNYDKYMQGLVDAYNPAAAAAVMCRNILSVGWDGYLYDCDFNQMLELKTESGVPQHISEFNLAALNQRNIVVNRHCFGCTAGAGSSCGGTTA